MRVLVVILLLNLLATYKQNKEILKLKQDLSLLFLEFENKKKTLLKLME